MNDDGQPKPKPGANWHDTPEWALQDSQAHIRQSMLEHPDLWVAAARYESLRGPGRENRIALIISASEFEAAKSVSDWLVVAREYSSCDMQTGGKTRGKNPDKPARAFYIETAILKLLELADAPQEIVNDFRHFLKPSLPISAEKRANLQAILIDHPELADDSAGLAKKAECDRKLVDRYLKDGSVQPLPLDT